MAQLVTGVIGAGIGYVASGFNPAGAYWGWTIGVAAGTLLFPPPDQHTTGPRLGDRSVQSSTYGVPIQIVYGTIRTSGNVIWATEIEEVSHTEEVGGKGGPSVTQTTYSYYGNFAVGICEGEAELLKVWANGKLLLDLTNQSLAGETTLGVPWYLSEAPVAPDIEYRFYKGTEDQLPDPLMELHEGVGQVPAHRGLCYIVFERLPLADFGNGIPQLSFEVSRQSSFTPGEARHVQNIAVNDDQLLMDWVRGYMYTQDGGASVFSGTAIVAFDFKSMTLETHAYTDILEGFTDNKFIGIMPTSRNLVFHAVDQGRYVEVSPDTWKAVDDYPASGNAFDEADQTGINAVSFTVDNEEFITYGGVIHNKVLVQSGVGKRWGMQLNQSMHLLPMLKRGQPGSTAEEDGFYVALVGGGLTGDLRIGHLVVDWADVNIAWEPTWTYPARIVTSTEVDPAWPDFYNIMSGMLDETDGNLVFCIRGSVSNDDFRFFKIDTETWDILWVSQIAPGIDNGNSTNIEGGYKFSVLRHGRFVYISNTNPIKAYELDTTDGTITEIASGYSFNSLHKMMYHSALNAVVSQDHITDEWVIWSTGSVAGQSTTVGAVVSDLCGRVGWQPSDYDVSGLSGLPALPGYMVTRNMRATAAIEPLANLYLFDGVEVDDVFVFPVRGGAASGALDEQDLVQPRRGEPIEERRTAETELPVELTLTYMDPLNDYDQQTHRAVRIVEPEPEVRSVNKLNLQVAASLDRDFVKAQAQSLLIATWIERVLRTMRAGRPVLKHVPSDVLTLTLDDGRTVRTRLSTMAVGQDLTCELTAIQEDSSQYSASATADGGSGVIDQTPRFVPALRLILLMSPLLRDTDDVGRTYSQFYYFMGVPGSGDFSVGLLFRSDTGDAYEQIGSVLAEPTWGYATDALGSVPYDEVWVQDNVNSVNVMLKNELITPQSVTFDQLITGTTNAAALVHSNGDVEIIKFQTATQEADGSYTLSGLLRGRRGTDPFVSGHKTGDTFVLLGTAGGGIAPSPLGDVGVNKYHKAVAAGGLLEYVTPVVEDNPGNDLKPYAPVWIQSDGTLWGSDVAISWTRRTRINGGLVGGSGTVPLNEDTEEYELEVYDDLGALVRTVTGLTSPSWTYTVADQNADFVSAPNTIDIVVYQVSAQVGRGFPSHQTTIGV